jgi:hypothetical protein
VNVITTAPPEPPKTRRNAIRNRLRRPDVEPRELVAGAGTALAQATARAYKSGIDRLLTSPERVASVAEANALLESDEHFEELSDRVQKVALAAVPMLRIARGAGRFARIPPVLIASTALAAGMTVRRGVRELQVIAALIEHRIEQATGERADPDLVKALAVAVYRSPKYEPAPTREAGVRLAPLAARWALRGAIGRDTGSAASRALEAADRLDAAAQAGRWKASDET